MKWLFIGALLLNISFFVYNFFIVDESTTKNAVVNKSDKSQIVLLSELDSAELKNLQNIKKPAEKMVQHVSDPETSAVSDESKRLKTELPDQPQSIKNDSSEISGSTDIQTNNCYKLGPFTKKDMDDIRLTLEKEYQNTLSFGIEPTSTTTYYRIYIPPLKSKDKITETLAQLDAKGLKDHYVMSIDGRKNAIALGVFKERIAAEKVAVKANKVGFSTIIEAITDDKNSQYNLQLEFHDNLDMTRYQELISSKNLKSSECEK